MAGYDIIPYDSLSHSLARRAQLISANKINIVLDVGANIGQYGKQLREIGYKNKILSFEPISSLFKKLKINTSTDHYWEALNFALGEYNETEEINISENSYSNSLLEMLPAHIKAAPDSKYMGKQKIDIKSLDSIFHNICSNNDNIYLKIDTQGYESKVLTGATKSLSSIKLIQLELSLVPLYKNEVLFIDMYNFLIKKKYTLVSIEPGFSCKDTGQLLQVDAIFSLQNDENN